MCATSKIWKARAGAHPLEGIQQRKATPGLDQGLKVVLDRNFNKCESSFSVWILFGCDFWLNAVTVIVVFQRQRWFSLFWKWWLPDFPGPALRIPPAPGDMPWFANHVHLQYRFNTFLWPPANSTMLKCLRAVSQLMRRNPVTYFFWQTFFLVLHSAALKVDARFSWNDHDQPLSRYTWMQVSFSSSHYLILSWIRVLLFCSCI